MGPANGSTTKGGTTPRKRKLLLYITEDYYVVSHRLPLAIAALAGGYDVTIVTRERNCGDLIRSAGLRVVPFENARGSLNPLSDLGTIVRLIAVYRREQPDIVHHVAMKPVLYGSLAAKIVRRARVVNAIAGMGWLFTAQNGRARWLQPVVRQALKRLAAAGLMIVQNQDDAAMLVELGMEASRIRLIPGVGVDLDLFRPSPPPSGPPTVVMPARLLRDKGVGEFVAAARLLRSRGVDARFVIAGEPDPLNPASVTLADVRAWTSEGLIEHPGFVADMPGLLAQSHIVCLPSYREGLPKSLMEAAAAGRAIVTTDVPGCREAVRDGYNGFLVPPRSATALATALERLIGDPALRDEMGRHGRLVAERRFDQDAIIRQTLALYDELTAS
jgi:glycosyltransferase involved in cell wall biosynthesis